MVGYEFRLLLKSKNYFDIKWFRNNIEYKSGEGCMVNCVNFCKKCKDFFILEESGSRLMIWIEERLLKYIFLNVGWRINKE